MAHPFVLPSSVQLVKNIWNKLKNHTRFGINLTELSGAAARKECEKIIEYSRNLVVTQLDWSGSFKNIRKTTFGYSVQFACSNGRCKSSWYIRINNSTNEVKASCKKPCDHLISIEKSKFLILISYFNLFVNIIDFYFVLF